MIINDLLDLLGEKDEKLTFRLLDADESGGPLVLIEGSQFALDAFGKMLVAIANSPEADPVDFWMSPTGPGCIHFAKNSDVGFYINRISGDV